MTETPDITSTPLDWVGKTLTWDGNKRFHIEAVEPCNEWYYRMTGANPKIPRWNVRCRPIRPNRPLGAIREFALTADALVA